MSDKKYTSIHHENAPGRVEFKGGKAVWQWAQGQNDSTSILIKSLDNPELELEKTQRTPLAPRPGPKRAAKPGAAPADARSGSRREDRDREADDTLRRIRGGRGTGFDPYNRS